MQRFATSTSPQVTVGFPLRPKHQLNPNSRVSGRRPSPKIKGPCNLRVTFRVALVVAPFRDLLRELRLMDKILHDIMDLNWGIYGTILYLSPKP